MSNRPVISIRDRKRGTTRFLIGSTPRTRRASSSSRILRAPRSAVIAVPATPATTTAVTSGPIQRTAVNTKKPPRRSRAPNSERAPAACSPGAPRQSAKVETSSGNQESFSTKRNCQTSSSPYGYGGRTAETIVFAVRIIISPTCSKADLAGSSARLTIPLLPSPLPEGLARRSSGASVLSPPHPSVNGALGRQPRGELGPIQATLPENAPPAVLVERRQVDD